MPSVNIYVFLLYPNITQDSGYMLPHPSYIYLTHPEIYLAATHKHTPMGSKGCPPQEMRTASGTRAVACGGTASTRA